MQNERIKPGKGRRQLIFMLILFLIPPLSAWLVWQYMQANGVDFTNNAGTLISPARPLPKDALVGISGVDLQKMKGRWRYVIFADKVCNQRCEDQLHLTRQTRLSTNKDIQRIRRVLIINAELDADFVQKIAKEHPDLIVARITDSDQAKKWKNAFVGEAFSAQGEHFFLVDPLGNLMMYYDLTVQPKRLLKDLTKLLKVSQIG